MSKKNNDQNVDWIMGVVFPITVSDKNGIIISKNEAAIKQFSSDGGISLIGKSLFDYHPESARLRLRQMLLTHHENTYINQSTGKKQLIHDASWFSNGKFQGYVEISIDIPEGIC